MIINTFKGDAKRKGGNRGSVLTMTANPIFLRNSSLEDSNTNNNNNNVNESHEGEINNNEEINRSDSEEDDANNISFRFEVNFHHPL